MMRTLHFLLRTAALAFAAALALATLPLAAQQSTTVTGGLNGTITDTSGAVVPGATVTIQGPQGTRTQKTDAQVQTTETAKAGTPTHQVKVLNAEVVAVQGNDLIVRMEDGSLRHFANVPESARVTVDGEQLGIHDLKPGMRLQKTITTTTTPKVITTTQTVTGKVWHVSPPNSVILTLEDGKNQSFKIPKDQKFLVNGMETDAFGLQKGMIVTATKVVEEPVTVVEEQAKLTGQMPPPPPPPAADMPFLVVIAEPVPVPVPAPAPSPAVEEAALPATGSELPLVALLGLLSLAGSAGLRIFRRVGN